MGGEHAYDLLMVSVSMSIENCEKTGSTPGFRRYANPDATEFQRFHLTVPRHDVHHVGAVYLSMKLSLG